MKKIWLALVLLLLWGTPLRADMASGGGGGGGSMVYPGAGVPQSTGSAWGDSLTLDTSCLSVSASDDSVCSAKTTAASFLKVSGAFTAFAANDTTPSVTGGTRFRTANTSSIKTITALDDGAVGDLKFIYVNDAFTAWDCNNDSGSFMCNGGADFTSSNGDLIMAYCISANVWQLTFLGNISDGGTLFRPTSVPTGTSCIVQRDSGSAAVCSGTIRADALANDAVQLVCTDNAGEINPCTVTGLTLGGTTTPTVSVDQQIGRREASAFTQDKVYYRTSGSAWAEADANGSGTYPARCYAVSTGYCISNGQYTKATHGFTVGADVYLSETAGAITSTAPTGSGSVVQKIGWIIDANTIYIAVSPDYVTLQ